MESRDIFDAFISKYCAGCHGAKAPRRPFCIDCYQQLPKALQRSLWKKHGDGFDQAYMACLSWFRTHPLQGNHRARQESLFEKGGAH
jgi:hypothetical protein